MNRTTTTSIAVLVTASILAAACSGGDDDTADSVESATTEASTSTTEDSTTTTSTSSTTVAPSTTVPDVIRMPLTGEPVSDASDIPDRPALVAKISNAPGSVLPQAGLNAADLVIEEVINDQVTRLAAVFHSQDADPVGPIRSGRAQDIDLLLSLDRPLFAWSGGNPAVTRAVRESDLVNLSALGSPGYYRRSGRRSPNNLYTDTEALWAQTTDEAGRPSLIFVYLEPGEEPEGEPATEIDIRLDSTDARWVYDEESGLYERSQDGNEHNTETSDGVERVTADNVVVMLADYGVNPADGNPDAQVLGSNPVYVFSRGTVREGAWLRFQPEDPFDFYDASEEPIGLVAGRTWLEIPRNTDGVLAWS